MIEEYFVCAPAVGALFRTQALPSEIAAFNGVIKIQCWSPLEITTSSPNSLYFSEKSVYFSSARA
jgi:hypothetical protein